MSTPFDVLFCPHFFKMSLLIYFLQPIRFNILYFILSLTFLNLIYCLNAINNSTMGSVYVFGQTHLEKLRNFLKITYQP